MLVPVFNPRVKLLILLALAAVIAAMVYLILQYQNDPATKIQHTQSTATTAVKADRKIQELPALPEEIAEPEEITVMAPQTAKTINSAIPFAGGRVETAAPFRFRGSAADRARALDCLAAAQLYEAGGDAEGQRAVAQVVLNRVRHAAFPSSICGVVFQGSERRTGCQFSFTCDGSLRRRYSDALWQSARGRAAKAIDGDIYKKVQTATHYHTDWVHPYWSAKLHKVTAVDTHLFFRWPGYWGTRPAFKSGGSGEEPPIAKLAFRASHADARQLAGADEDGVIGSDSGTDIPADTIQAAKAANADILGGNQLVSSHPPAGAYLVKLKRGQGANNMLTLGLRLCGNQNYCNIMGWLDARAIPSGWPVDPDARSRMTFNYVRDRSRGVETVLFDCKLFKRPLQEQCL